jgi:putative aldouronate transport system substrate-binding protein
MYRKDWAQKLGVDNPKNANDVMRMFVAFSNEDPNGDGKKDTYGLDNLHSSVWNSMFRVPNNWRLNKDGTMTKDLETQEFRAATSFARELWKKGAFYPDALTITLNQRESLLTSGKTGFFTQGGWAYFGNQPGTLYTLAKEVNPAANLQPWLQPGHDGGNPAMPLGNADYGFGAIPSTIKSEARIVELLKIMDYMAAPLGSVEFNYMYHGIEGQMYNLVNGAPVGVTNGNQNWANGLNYLCGCSEINYFFANQPGQAQVMQNWQAKQIEMSIPDPSQGLYSPTWVSQGANLIQLQVNAYNSIVVGNQPLSYLDTVISDWKSQGGGTARKEFQKALEKCK